MGSGAADPISAPQLKEETQSLCCCLLLVSEDNHQLFCQVGPINGPIKPPTPYPITPPYYPSQVVGDRVLEEEISFSVRAPP